MSTDTRAAIEAVKAVVDLPPASLTRRRDAMEKLEPHLPAILAALEACQRLPRVEEVLARLYETVSEQQYTLASKGWHEEGPLSWTAAGARRHQYHAVDLALRDACGALEGKPKDELGEWLLRIKNKVAKSMPLFHTQPCRCYCCDLVREIAGVNALASPAPSGEKLAGEGGRCTQDDMNFRQQGGLGNHP